MSVQQAVAYRLSRWLRLVVADLQSGQDVYRAVAGSAEARELHRAVGSAADLVLRDFDQAWPPASSPYRDQLLRDIDSLWLGAEAELRDAVISAWWSASPSDRARAVARAAAAVIWKFGFRSEMTLNVAATRGQGEKLLSGASSGAYKKWRCRRGPDGRPDKNVCEWCRFLDAQPAIPVGQEFSLAGHRSIHRPPRTYLDLLAPPCHPRCRCRVVLVKPGAPEPGPAGLTSPPEQLVGTISVPDFFISAAAIRAMPEDRYLAISALHRAAVCRLGNALLEVVG